MISIWHQEKINVEDYLFLVRKVARKFRNKFSKEKIEDTEAYSIASIELVRAGKLYNSDVVDTNFEKFAYRLMCNGVIQNFRYQNRQKRQVKTEALVDIGKEDKEDYSSLLNSILNSTDEESSLLRDVYLNDKKIKEIAKDLNLSRVAVYNRVHRSLEVLRNRLE